jgi:hypothetical protein
VWRLLADENFNHRIVRLLKLREPTVDVVFAQDTELAGVPDPRLLAWAAETDRILLTHDFQTMPGYAFERVYAREKMPGMVAVQQNCDPKLAAEEIQMILVCCADEEIIDHVWNVPF